MNADYTLRRFRAEDAPAVGECVARIYGQGYPRAELYAPEAIVHHNATGAWISFVAEDPRGRVVGHMALELSANGPVAEMGMGMVLPEHRQHRLVERMRDLIVEEARGRGLAGQFVEIATDNAAAQAMANRSLARPCGLTLGLWPGGASDEPRARRSFVRYFRYLRAPVVAVAHAPAHHHEVLARIYAELGAPVTLGHGAPPEGRDRMSVERHAGWQSTFIAVQEIGEDTAAALTVVHRAFEDDAAMESAYLELPLAQPGAASACAHAEELGFFFSGVCPHGARDGDALRMQCLKGEAPIARASLTHPFARELVDYVVMSAWRRAPP